MQNIEPLACWNAAQKQRNQSSIKRIHKTSKSGMQTTILKKKKYYNTTLQA